MRKLILFIFVFSIAIKSFGQTDTCHLRVSLLTCSPGEELYSTFGHTALRVQDLISGDDLVFNYGSFEFGPDFYMEFIRGKLRYFLSVSSFSEFQSQYQWESRSILEQELLLSCANKQTLFERLIINAREENRYYRYDFLFDNCTTRARDIVAGSATDSVQFRNILPPQHPTFRNLIHTYLNFGGQYWSKLGIDILLGADLDKEVSNQQAMFLPDYLKKGFDSARIDVQPLASPAVTILQMPSSIRGSALFRPAIVFSLLLAAIAILSFISHKKIQRGLQVFDFLLFFVAGLAGVLLLFMWFGTDHTVCRNNFNLLWALPTHVVGAFIIGMRKKWVSWYLLATIIPLAVLLIGWIFLPQEINLALLPLVLLILLRAWLAIVKTEPDAKEAHSIQGSHH